MTTRTDSFPIQAQVTGAGGALHVKIQRLTAGGCLVETEKALGIGQHYTVSFVLPGYHEAITASGVVVKSYAGLGGAPGKAKSHILDEIHFKPLGEKHKVMIENFIKLVGSAGGKR
ncbi:MAG TPA: PilZ domain-containing protein [Bdellovibrionales bacterium]|nr:PilZ domain-containing protein [Bdellovibrionales bacterium]